MASDTREAIASDFAEFEEAKEPRSRERNKAMMDKFVQLYLERSADYKYDSYIEMLKSCYSDAGYKTDKDNGVAYHARKLLERCWPAIEEAISTSLKGGSAIALNTLIELCTDCRQPAVRLKAATELLNKAGFQETQKHEIKTVEDLSDEQLQKEIQDKMAAHGLKVVAVGSNEE